MDKHLCAAMLLVWQPSLSQIFGTDKLTRRRGPALLDGDCSAQYVDESDQLERALRSKDA